MTSYTPVPYPLDFQIPGYGLYGPTVDGLLIARAIIGDSDETWAFRSKIDRAIAAVQLIEVRK